MNDRTPKQAIAATLCQWWQALQPREKKRSDRPPPSPGSFEDLLGRADRARLRRCRTAEELLMDPATILLDDRLLAAYAARVHVIAKDDPSLHTGIALTAGILSHVVTDAGAREPAKSLATRLGEPVGEKGEGRRLMSELRFRNLQSAHTPNELLRQCIRAVSLAENNADVGALGTDLLLWFDELERPPRRPALSVRYRWARDYYLATAKKLATDEVPSPETEDDA